MILIKFYLILTKLETVLALENGRNHDHNEWKTFGYTTLKLLSRKLSKITLLKRGKELLIKFNKLRMKRRQFDVLWWLQWSTPGDDSFNMWNDDLGPGVFLLPSLGVVLFTWFTCPQLLEWGNRPAQMYHQLYNFPRTYLSFNSKVLT